MNCPSQHHSTDTFRPSSILSFAWLLHVRRTLPYLSFRSSLYFPDYLPTYYQACKDASAFRSAVLMLGLSLSMGPIVVAAGVSVSILKVYRPQLWLAWVFYIVGTGVFTTIRADSTLSQGIGWPVLMGAGSGILYGACRHLSR